MDGLRSMPTKCIAHHMLLTLNLLNEETIAFHVCLSKG